MQNFCNFATIFPWKSFRLRKSRNTSQDAFVTVTHPSTIIPNTPHHHHHKLLSVDSGCYTCYCFICYLVFRIEPRDLLTSFPKCYRMFYSRPSPQRHPNTFRCDFFLTVRVSGEVIPCKVTSRCFRNHSI